MTAPLHVVTNDAVLADPVFPARARAVLAAGGSEVVLHLRGYRTSGRRLFELTRTLERSGSLAINDRVDIALATGCRHVHLGQRGLPVREVSLLLDPDATVGVSVHDAAEAEAAAAEADYLFAGHVFETESHPGVPGKGVEFLRETRAHVDRPVVAIGGITPERVSEVRGAGAHGVAALSGVWSAGDPGARVSRYLEALRER